jgi:hypothetical protein
LAFRVEHDWNRVPALAVLHRLRAASTPSENAAPTPDNAIMLTIFLKHDETRPLAELNAQLEKQGFYKAFPPPGVVVTLRLPASRLREINRIFETTA